VEPSPGEIRRDIEALDIFRERYVAYLDAGPGDDGAKRRVIESIPAAQRALEDARAVFAVQEPPEVGPYRRTYRGLMNTAFLHEQPGWQPHVFSDGPAVYERVLDGVSFARARLVDLDAEVRRARRRPTYWIDRALRSLLLVPAYLLSLVIGGSPLSIDRSKWGLPLRVLAIVADALAIYTAGQLFEWW
jgi:hypothetical protein